LYYGTTSKSLATGLRLGWMVLPEDLVPEVLAAKWHSDWMSSALEQLTLAEFISSGAYERHVRSMRLRYRRRRDQLVAALAQRAPGIQVTGIAAGLHAVVELPPGTEDSVVEAAARQGLAVSGMARFRYDAASSARDASARDASARDAPPGLDAAPAPDALAGRDALVVGYATTVGQCVARRAGRPVPGSAVSAR